MMLEYVNLENGLKELLEMKSLSLKIQWKN